MASYFLVCFQTGVVWCESSVLSWMNEKACWTTHDKSSIYEFNSIGMFRLNDLKTLVKEWPRMIQYSATNLDQKLQVHHLWRAYGLQSLQPNGWTTKRTGGQPERDTTCLRFLIQIPSNFNFVIEVLLTWCLQCSEVWTFFLRPRPKTLDDLFSETPDFRKPDTERDFPCDCIRS